MQRHFFVGAALVLSTLLHAQQDSAYLQEVVVTANKYEKKQTQTGKVVSVISSEMLRQSGGRSLGELLNQVAGVTVPGANNNLGSNQTINIRGASAGNTLILLDGIPVNDPSVISNYFDINLLSIDQIERVEILKGGQSTLYGSDAVAGVVNIISKKTTREKNKPAFNASVSGGSFGTLRSSLGVSGQQNKLDYLLQLSAISSQGFSAATDTSGIANFDKDNYRQQTVRLQVGYKTGTHSRLSLNNLYSRYHTALDAGAFADEKDFIADNTNKLSGIGWQLKKENTLLQLNYQYNEVERAYLDDSSYRSSSFVNFVKSNYTGITHFAEVYLSKKSGSIEWLGGVDYRKHQTTQSYWSTGPWGPYAPPVLKASFDQLSPYASLVFSKDNLIIEAGGRFNHHSVYGNNLTYTFNPAYRLNAHTKLFANLYSAFKAPTLYQLFDPGAGNTSLQPEQGSIQELGLEWTKGRIFRGRVVAFNRESRSTIIYSYNPVTWSGNYINASTQHNYGVEIETQLAISAVTIRANYAYTDGRIEGRYSGTGLPLGKDTSYFNLYRIPKHAFNVSASYGSGQWLFTLSGRAASNRQEFIYGAAPQEMDGYVTFDLYGEYRFKNINGMRAFIDLRNLSDTRYEELRGYTARGINLMAGLLFSR
jgi:vitamin B12 transporter